MGSPPRFYSHRVVRDIATAAQIPSATGSLNLVFTVSR